MTQRLTPEDFDTLFRHFRHTAFRLEVQPAYAVDVERQALADFLRGESKPATDYPYYAAWLDEVRRVAGEGKQIQRVRVLEVPPTPYQAFEMHMARYNLAAGETLRTMTRSAATAVQLPATDDWWLFDNQRVARMRFAADGTPLGGHIITEPTDVSQYREWRDLAVHHSAPVTECATAA